jgi:alginate O-acetyltransferase complex protein AlgI
MALSTAVSYFAGLGFLRWQEPHRRRVCLIVPIVFDLLLLSIFKYANFVAASIDRLLHLANIRGGLPIFDIVLPVGISFYTFHTITYIVDSYRRVLTPTRNFFEFSCYVSLYSQLVAGPIVRFREIEKDLEHIDRPDAAVLLERGWSFFALGMVKKVIIADTIASAINPSLYEWRLLSTAGAWFCVLGYTYQIYFDFSGYSDMAVGLGMMFGLRLPQNFNSPYKALDISDFWRRWHMSLSRVLRDYLYIPLGGSRDGGTNTYRNLMLTMLLGGLWHGAAWNFVVWGGCHGALLSATRLFGKHMERWRKEVRACLTFMLVVIGWVLFRSSSMQMALGLLRKMITPSGGTFPNAWLPLVALVLAAFLAHFGPNTWELTHKWSPGMRLLLVALFGICLMVIYGGQQAPFLYYQF